MNDTVGKYVDRILKRANGFYVDVGANVGIGDKGGVGTNETVFLEEIGWEGICIEGHPLLYDMLKSNRKAKVYNAFVAGKSGESRKVLQMSTMYGGTCIVDNVPETQTKFIYDMDPSATIVEVTTKNLEEILDELGTPQHIQLLKIDTEGTCLEIIKSLSFTKYTFEFISVELGFFNNLEEGKKYLESKGYTLVNSFNQNEIFRYAKS